MSPHQKAVVVVDAVEPANIPRTAIFQSPFAIKLYFSMEAEDMMTIADQPQFH